MISRLLPSKKGSIAKQITAVATFFPTQNQDVFFPESGGRIRSIDVNVGDAVKAGAVLAQLEPGDLEYQIKMQKLQYEKADIALQQVKSGSLGNADSIRTKMIDVEKEKLQLDHLQEQLAKTKLKAAISGIVTYIDTLKGGDQVTAYKPVVTIANPKQLQLIYDASNPNDISSVQVGMEVAVKVKSDAYTGKVVQTPSSAPLSTNKTESERNAKRLIIAVNGLKDDVTIGSMADIVITTEMRDDVLIIPRTGLRTFMGRDYVQVLEGESRKEVDVEKGIVSATEVEIRKGLKEGSNIILNN